MRVTGNSPLARSLNEHFEPIVEDTNKVVDSWGDQHKLLHNCVRNEAHPNWNSKSEDIAKDEESGLKFENVPKSIWVNTRSGTCHEGSMVVGPDGRAHPRQWMTMEFVQYCFTALRNYKKIHEWS